MVIQEKKLPSLPCSDYNHTWYGVGEYYSGTNDTITPNMYWLLNFNNIFNSFSKYLASCAIEQRYVCTKLYLKRSGHISV